MMWMSIGLWVFHSACAYVCVCVCASVCVCVCAFACACACVCTVYVNVQTLLMVLLDGQNRGKEKMSLQAVSCQSSNHYNDDDAYL